MTKRNRRMNLLYLPALGLVLLFVLLPLVTSVKTSFYNWNGYSPVKKCGHEELSGSVQG